MDYPKFGEAALSPLVKLLTSLLAVLILIVFIACSDDAAPGDCIDAARDAGVPDRVIEWMKDPVEEWGTIERIAIREALEKFGIGEFCADVEQKLTFVESSPMNNALEMAKDAAKAAALTPSPEPPAPAPNPTRRPASTPLPAPTAARAPIPTPVAVALTPKPTPRPLATPLTAPTAAPLPTSTPSPSDTTRITHVTFSGVAGEESSRFTVHFSRSIVIDLPPDFDHDDAFGLTVGYPDGYDDRLYYYSTNNLHPASVSSSALRSKRPISKLSFGPVEREFVVAYYLWVAAGALENTDGSPAFDQQLIQLPGNTVFLNPDHSIDVNDPNLVSCVAFMEFIGIPSPVVRSVKDLYSDTLTDSEREEWRNFLLEGEYIQYSDMWGGSSLWKKEPCSTLWSEDNSERNATKRNRDWEADCLDHGFAREDMLTLANRPYADLSATDRIVLQMIMDDGDCRVFYPQLFYGRWVPMTTNQ